MNDVVSLIPKGEGNKITAGEISMLTGKPGSMIRRAINAARASKIPVASDGDGYWLATNRRDIENTIRSLTHRINKMQDAIAGLTEALEEM